MTVLALALTAYWYRIAHWQMSLDPSNVRAAILCAVHVLVGFGVTWLIGGAS